MDTGTSGLKDTKIRYSKICTKKYGFDRIGGAIMGCQNTTSYSKWVVMTNDYIRAIAFHDTPLKGGYIVGILIRSTLFQSRRFLHLEKGSLQAYPLKITIIQRLVQVGELSEGWFNRLPELGI